MPFANLNGINTRYEEVGDGPPLLMYSPGGFDATVEKWSGLGVYQRINILGELSRHYRCILFDRRETGQSGGRVEIVTWGHYVDQGRALLDFLGIDKAHLLGGCMGVSPVALFAARHPERVHSMVLYWPVGGARYRINGEMRFARHLAFVAEHGPAGVVALANETTETFGKDPRVGPWASVIRGDEAFASRYAGLDKDRYILTLTGMRRALLDRDTAPGAEPEALLTTDVPAIVIPGADAAHATSAARYLAECLPGSEYVNIAPDEQTVTTTPPRILDFLAQHAG